MKNKKILYFKATENDKEIIVQEPVEKNIISAVVSELMSEWGTPLTRYSIDYHMAYMHAEDEDYEFTPEIFFVGKQNDFFFFLRVREYSSTDESKVDKEQVLDLINSGKGELQLYWWESNDALATDNPGIKRMNGELVYDIELTDEITLQVAVEGEEDNMLFLDDMRTLCNQVTEDDYSLSAF